MDLRGDPGRVRGDADDPRARRGALAVAGVKRLAERGELPPGPVVAIASGANMNFGRLGYVAERAQVGEHRGSGARRHHSRAGGIVPGVLSGGRGAQHHGVQLPAGRARGGARLRRRRGVGDRRSGRALVAFASRARATLASTAERTTISRRPTCGTWLVGAAVEGGGTRCCWSFEFPERPGALLEFLSSLESRWNISLFHYRNNGAAFGRVLCGLEVAPGERAELRRRLEAAGFGYVDGLENHAARLFLR